VSTPSEATSIFVDLSSKMTVLHLAVFAVIVSSVTAQLKCYDCKEVISGQHAEFPAVKCRDAFIPESTTYTPSDIDQVTCSAGQQMCYKSISETYQTGLSGRFISSYVISRGCLNTTSSDPDECEVGPIGQGHQSVCFCSSNLCNSSSFNSLSLVTLAFSLILAVGLLKIH